MKTADMATFSGQKGPGLETEEDERIYQCFEAIKTPKKETRQAFQM